MEFGDVVRRRRMVRSFLDRPVPVDVVDRVLDAGRRAPSAGNSQGWAFVVLEGREQTERYWRTTFDEARREGFRWQGLFAAPVLVVALAHPQAYVDRYAEPDKAGAGDLGVSKEAWPVPFWTVDTSFAVMAMLLAAVDEGLGACFFGIFAHEAELLAELGVPAGYEPVGTVALGWPDPADEPGLSARRKRRPWDEVVHRHSFVRSPSTGSGTPGSEE